jgi:hypothetical protein
MMLQLAKIVPDREPSKMDERKAETIAGQQAKVFSPGE